MSKLRKRRTLSGDAGGNGPSAAATEATSRRLAEIDRKIRARSDLIASRSRLPPTDERQREIKSWTEQLRALGIERRNVLGGIRNGQLRQHPERDARIAAEVNGDGLRRERVRLVAKREGLSESRVYAIMQAHRRSEANRIKQD
jgi:hypothetical protein